MEIIITEKEAIRAILAEELHTIIRTVFKDFGFSSNMQGAQSEKEGWVGIEQAKKIVPIKSKKKWKELRDEAQVDFARVGKGFIYEVSSLHTYILRKSTIKAKSHGRNSK